jgi:hypothetical protein
MSGSGAVFLPADVKVREEGELSVNAPGRLPELLAEYSDVEKALSDPSVHADASRARTLGRRFAELAPIATTAGELDVVRDDLATARELSGEDASFAAEAQTLAGRVEELEARLRHLLVPKDPNDSKHVILEIKAGEGGEESALFAGDLLRMYLRYAERQGWTTEILDDEPTDLGGKKSVTVAVRGRRADQAVWAQLKYEGGVHRVQRVPPPSPRAGSTPPPRACSYCPRPRRSTWRSTPTTCASTSTAPPGPAGRVSTPPTPRCALRTCPRARW